VNKEKIHKFVAGLQWSDVHAKMLTLPAEKSKNREPRKCPISGELAELIARREQTKLPGCSLIFHRGDGSPLGDYHHLWKRAIKLAGCEGRIIHDLRRSRVRALTRAGVPEAVCMKLTGHKTRSVFDRYNITSERDLQDAQEKTEVYLQQQEKVLSERIQ
jgi:integrase